MQHAFGKWHSCETQLATVINDWAKILDNKGQVDTFDSEIAIIDLRFHHVWSWESQGNKKHVGKSQHDPWC